MGRDKANKPRKQLGAGGLKPDVLAALEEFPMNPAEVLDKPDVMAMVMLRVGMDGAVMALRRVYDNAGRLAYFEAAFDKGLNVEQAERLEGLVIFLQNLAKAVSEEPAELG
jgi:hypothetical protein